MKRLMILAVLLFALAGCSTMSYTSKDGTTVTYKRLLTGSDVKMKVGDVSIQSQGAGALDLQTMLDLLKK